MNSAPSAVRYLKATLKLEEARGRGGGRGEGVHTISLMDEVGGITTLYFSGSSA